MFRETNIRRYRRSLLKRPVLMQSVTTAVGHFSFEMISFFNTLCWLSPKCLFVVGDGLAQHGVERKSLSSHDMTRTARMTLYGGGMVVLAASNFPDSFSSSLVCTSGIRSRCNQMVPVFAKPHLFEHSSQDAGHPCSSRSAGLCSHNDRRVLV